MFWMKKDTFNKIIRFGNIIIKLSTEHTSIVNEMLQFDSWNIKKYEYDIKDVGIKISKVYLSICIDNKNFNSRIYWWQQYFLRIYQKELMWHYIILIEK